MVNPGTFSGSRKEFLTSLKAYYAVAVDDGTPSDEHLASVDDDAAVPEVEGPNPDVLTLEEYGAVLSKWEDRQKLILFRKAQIKQWFAYQFMKDTDLDSTQTGLFNPYCPLLTKLTGKKINAPHQRSAANVWRKMQHEVIKAEVQVHLAAREEETGEKMKKENLVAFQDTVARNLFKNLTEEEQCNWQLTAVAEHNTVTREWKVEMERKPQKDPQSRQVAIQGLIKFIQPILDLICNTTGWKASLICRGPEPAQAGLLNVVSIHSGATSGDVKMIFGRAEREQFRKVVVPLYGSFLQKCYTPVECRSQALRGDQGFLPLAGLDLDNEGASVNPVTPPSAHPPPIHLGPPPILTQIASKAQQSKTTTKPASAAAARTHIKMASAPAPGHIAMAMAPASAPAHIEMAMAPPPPPPPGHVAMARAPAPAPGHVATARAPAPAPGHVTTASAPAPAPAAEIMPSAAVQPPLHSPSMPSTAPRVPTHPPPSNFLASVPQPQPLSTVHGVACSEVQVDEAVTRNPFPFEIPDSPQPMIHDSRGNISQPPTLQPLPCPSPIPQTRGVFLLASGALMQPEDPLSSTIASEEDREPLSATTVATLEDEGVKTPKDIALLCRSNRGLKANGKSNDKAKLVGKGGTKRRLEESQVSGNSSTTDPRTKQQRTATQATDTFRPPDNAPKWFKNAFHMLSSKDLGEEWRAMVACWGCFELEAGFGSNSRLRTEGRPGAIGDWIQRARSSTWHPHIPVPDVFGSEVKGWWQRLQPKWRIRKDGTLQKDLDGDCEELRRPGVNGLLSVAVALLYWGEALQSSKAGNEEWLEVVLDFQLVLSKLT